MRVGFRVTRGGSPVGGARIRCRVPACLIDISVDIAGIPVPTIVREAVTDENGEWFGVAPIAVAPALYYLDVDVTDGESTVRVRGLFREISNMIYVDLESGSFEARPLDQRIPGDGYNIVFDMLITEEDLIDVSGDPVRAVSRCSICLYYERLTSTCVVNGPRMLIPIADPENTTCPLYYPFFLPPSPVRLSRDLPRGVPLARILAPLITNTGRE